MLYPQNGDRNVTIDSVAPLRPIYAAKHYFYSTFILLAHPL